MLLIAGTAWLFAREDMARTPSTRSFVDEAGQVSLADALAVGTCARNVVLLGDPQQLAQVSQGIHPSGAGASVLEHLLGDEATVPPDRGLFLDTHLAHAPRRLRFISETFYEGRLTPVPACGASGSTRRALRHRPALAAGRRTRATAPVGRGGRRDRRASSSC